jgi:GNAT superfamily N-acetyltransferase
LVRRPPARAALRETDTTERAQRRAATGAPGEAAFGDAVADHDQISIRVRRATARDTAAVAAFTSTTWDGWDYLPDVWASWLEARDGTVFAAEAAEAAESARPAEAVETGPGRPIAVGRVALLSATEAWMEGLRVDPAIRGHGVATAFQAAELSWAQAQGATVVRYATGETNEASLHLGARHGFAMAGRWRALRPEEPNGIAPSPAGRPKAGATPPKTAPKTPPGRAAILERLDAAGLLAREPAHSGTAGSRLWERLATDPTFVAAERLYEWRAWAWQAFTRERLARHAEHGDLLFAEDGGHWALGLLAGERLSGETRLALLGGDATAALRLIDEVTKAAARRPIVRLPDRSPLIDGLAPSLVRTGWRVADHALVLMARALRDAAGRPRSLPTDGMERVEFVEEPHPLGLRPAR